MNGLGQLSVVPEGEVARRAYEKWLTRIRAWNHQVQDWLDAETELGALATLTRQLAESQNRMGRLLGELRTVEGRLSEEACATCPGRVRLAELQAAEGRLHGQEHDRRIGREIQQGLLPAAMPRLSGFEISGKSLPANVVGGDCFDFIDLPHEGQDCLGVLVVDASGHGIGAALLAGQARAYLRALALTCADVGILLDLTNRRLSRDIVADHFVTAFLVSLNPRTRTLHYSNAGHMAGYVLGPGGQTRAVLPSMGLPLGIDLAHKYPASGAISLEPGDLVLMITDGIVEATSPAGELFGMERTLRVVRRHQEQMPGDILTALFDAVADFCKQDQLDDLTAVILSCPFAPR